MVAFVLDRNETLSLEDSQLKRLKSIQQDGGILDVQGSRVSKNVSFLFASVERAISLYEIHYVNVKKKDRNEKSEKDLKSSAKQI